MEERTDGSDSESWGSPAVDLMSSGTHRHGVGQCTGNHPDCAAYVAGSWKSCTPEGGGIWVCVHSSGE